METETRRQVPSALRLDSRAVSDDTDQMPTPVADTREFALLLCLARRTIDPETAARVDAALQQPVNWDSLLAMVLRHGTASRSYLHLSSRWPHTVPEHVLGRLRTTYRDTAQRNLVLAGRLCGIVEQFGSHGIPVISFKGPALGLSAYGDLSLRVSHDLDILVQSQDVLRAKALLQAQGFVSQYRMTARQETRYLRSNYDLPMNRDRDTTRLELHWALPRRWFSEQVDLAAALLHPRYTTFGSQQIPVLPPEEELLALCLHGGKHFWDRLLHICDVAELLRTHETLDWHRTLALADDSRSRRRLFLGSFMASEWLGAPLPEDVRRLVRGDRVVRELAHIVRRRAHGDRRPSETSLTAYRLQMQLRESWSEHARLLAGLCAPQPNDWEAFPLPDALLWLHYPIRAAGILRRKLALALSRSST